MSEKLIIEYARKIKAGEKVHRPVNWGGDFEMYCPGDGGILEFQYERGVDPYTDSVYECPTCQKEWTGSEILDVDKAFGVVEGKDPYEGTIFVGGDDFDPLYYTKEFPFDQVDDANKGDKS